MLVNNKLKVVFGLLWIPLFLSGLIYYPGEKLVFSVFSFVFLMMLFTGVYQSRGKGYLFLVIFLWLGFWFKLTASLMLSGGVPPEGMQFFFEEPVGQFDSAPDSWDKVLWIAVCASLGVMLGRFLIGLFFSQFPDDNAIGKTPVWYSAIRLWLWGCLILALAFVVVLNVAFGIHQIGLTPKTIFPFHLNALIAFLLNYGFAMAIAILIWWDIGCGKGRGGQIFAIIGEAFLSSVSMMSRSIFIFHAIPQLFVVIKRKEISERNGKIFLLIIASTFVVLLLVSIAVVSYMRDHQYKSAELAKVSTSKVEILAQPVIHAQSLRVRLIRQLIVNRWIGFEGVMAVSSYPEKNSQLFWKMLTEKREAGKMTDYQRISNSGYQSSDSKFQFASLPGAPAFFYYSGSLSVVILGMAIITLLMIAGEKIIFVLTKNPIVCSLFGMVVANIIAQFGITPRQDMPYLFLLFSSAVLICFLQSNIFTSLMIKFPPCMVSKQ